MAGAADSTIRYLRSPQAVRERCEAVFEFVHSGQSRHFRLDLSRLPGARDFTWQVMRESYPDPALIPSHSRVQHFRVGGIDRLGRFEASLVEPRERARALTELIVTSVLLDAGAGNSWSFTEPDTGVRCGRSEGLALASLHCFLGGTLSSQAASPWQADAAGLAALSAEKLGQAFQVREDNPLVGLEGRAALLRRLGEVLSAPLFCGLGRVGGLCDALVARASAGRLPAAEVLGVVLEALGPIWPARTQCLGVELGDVWFHAAAGGEGPSQGLVPFHKLSQWLSYSLIHPLAAAGVEVVEREALTGLAEYRNGGLFIDTGVIVPQHEAVTHALYPASSELVVEWRALTVALLDRLADGLRQVMGLDAVSLPLGKVLEAGSWAAGRRLAGELRHGASPITVQSDGTLF
ncbi:MAG TPA: URC4/urg3 family protein [Polyangiaceae bacterium]|nr:URC4/urg3 family protein [Polyangiaceae bacterium]